MNGHTGETAKAAVAYLQKQGLQMSFHWRFPKDAPPSQDVEAMLAEHLGGLKECVEGTAFEIVKETMYEILKQYDLKEWFLQEFAVRY